MNVHWPPAELSHEQKREWFRLDYEKKNGPRLRAMGLEGVKVLSLSPDPESLDKVESLEHLTFIPLGTKENLHPRREDCTGIGVWLHDGTHIHFDEAQARHIVEFIESRLPPRKAE